MGRLRAGIVDQALHVLDRCRIRWGTVVGREGASVEVSTRLLTWDGRSLGMGEVTTERVRLPVDDQRITIGDRVAMHWDYVCQPITEAQRNQLETYQAIHMDMVNRSGSRLAGRVER